jgi:hypothetical protein
MKIQLLIGVFLRIDRLPKRLLVGLLAYAV